MEVKFVVTFEISEENNTGNLRKSDILKLLIYFCYYGIVFSKRWKRWILENVPDTLHSNPTLSKRTCPNIWIIIHIVWYVTKFDMGFQKNNMRNRFEKIFFGIGDFLSFLNICKIAWINKRKNKFSKQLIKRQEYIFKHLIYTLFSRLKKKSWNFAKF